MQRAPVSVKKEGASSEASGGAIEADAKDTWTDYRLISGGSCGLDDGVRYHVMRFHSSQTVEPLKDLTHPVRLHRKDTLELGQSGGNIPPSNGGLGDVERGPVGPSDDKADVKAIAPYGGAQFGKKNQFKKLTRQVIHEDAKEKKIQEEETLPWVLEDFDGKNTWIGSMEGGQSYSHVFFVFAVSIKTPSPRLKYTGRWLQGHSSRSMVQIQPATKVQDAIPR